MRIPTLLALLALAASRAAALEPWQQFGPSGVDIAAMATVPGYPDDIYFVTATHPAQVHYTRDLGRTWTMLDTIHDIIGDLVVRPDAPDMLFATGARGLVYRSADGGRSWYVHGNLAHGAAGRRLAFHPDDPLVMWAAADIPDPAGGAGMTCYTSTDGGSSWQDAPVDSGFEVGARLLAADPHRAGRVFVGGSVNSRPRLFRSDDGGSGWTDISNGLAGTCAWDLAVNPNDAAVLVCVTDSGIFRSANSGGTWQLRRAAPAWSVAFAPSPARLGYAASDNLVFQSGDDGLTWSAETTDFRGSRTDRLFVNPANRLEVYVGSGSGIRYSGNGGYDWSDLTADFRNLTVPWLRFCPESTDTVYSCPVGHGLIRSTDRGLSWNRVHRFAGDGFVVDMAIHPRDPDSVFCVTSLNHRLLRTTDRGDSWEPLPVPDRFEARGIAFHPVEPDTMYAWGGQRESAGGPPLFRVFRSNNQGLSWTRILARGPQNGVCHGLVIPGGPDTIYAWGETDGFRALYRTTDRGGTWTSVAAGISGTAVRDFAISPADPGTWFVATRNGVFRATDHGETWDDLGLSDVSSVLPDSVDIDAVVAGTDTAGIYWTANAGVFWDRDTLGLASRAVLRLRTHPQDRSAVYCLASGSSILARGVVGISEKPASPAPGGRTVRPTVVRNAALVPGRFAGPAVLRLFRPDGRRATESLPFRRTGAGLVWSRPPNLAPGVYLLRVDAESGGGTYRVVFSP